MLAFMRDTVVRLHFLIFKTTIFFLMLNRMWKNLNIDAVITYIL